MIPYVVLLAAAGILGFFLGEVKPSRKNDIIYAAVITAAMLSLVICRGPNVGVDYDWFYKSYFEQVNSHVGELGYIFSSRNSIPSEFLYTLLNMAVAIFTDSPMVFFAIAGSLIVILRVIFLIKYSPKLWISIFLYIALGFYSYSLCTIRQELAISISMFALPFLLDRKPVPFFAIMIAAGFIHNSLFMLLPIYFIVLLPSAKKWVMALYTGGMLFVIMFSEALIELFTTLVPRFSLYSNGNYYLRGRDINTVIIWAVLLVLCVFYYKRIVERNPKNMMLFNLYLFGTLIMLLTTKTFIFQRVALMLLPYSVLLISEIFASLDFRRSAELAAAKSTQANKRTGMKKIADEEKRIYYSMMALFLFVALLEFFFLLNKNRLLLVPYETFWM